MTRSYLVRGMLAGLLAGLCAIAFAKVVAEPQISRAEAFERQLDIQARKPPEKPIVTRSVQDTIGLGTGVAVAGVALGGLFGLAFAGTYRRVTDAGARGASLGLAAAAFTAIFVIPFLKYPANPPSVGNPDTIGRRTALYFLLIGAGLLSVVLAAIVQRRAAQRLSGWHSTLIAAGVLAVAVTASYLLMPGINEVPAAFPATVLWNFRLASFGTQLTLWAALGLIFGELTARREAGASTPAGTSRTRSR